MRLNIDGHSFEVSIKPEGESYRIMIDEHSSTDTSVEGPLIHAGNITEHVRTVCNEDGTYHITIGQDTYYVEEEPEGSADETVIRSPMHGLITAVKVREGQKVKKGQTLVKIMSMKMENEIRADKDSVVEQVNVKKNLTVSKGDVLIGFSAKR